MPVEIPDADPDEPVETKPFNWLRRPFPQPEPHCWQNYVDYHKCINAKGEEFKPCRQFFLAYRSLCPKSWTDRWDDQREAGNFPARLDR
ncbi:TPA_exp: hypothetical protein A8136_2503 [Trichophyton benhamiae CBS 112371]|nr:TPA_exp: hypothetical protein A8136_2503 [Trichophyton benhamiae CBS 112371]